MTKEYHLIYQILGPSRRKIVVLAFAVQEAERLLFAKRIAADDILVTKDIYPIVAKRLKKNVKTVSRQVERLGNYCWEQMDAQQKLKYIGKELKDIRAPRELVFYFAFYVHFKEPYYKVVEKDPSLLFGIEDMGK